MVLGEEKSYLVVFLCLINLFLQKCQPIKKNYCNFKLTIEKNKMICHLAKVQISAKPKNIVRIP